MRCFSRADCLVSPVEPTWTRLVASDQPVIRTALFFCAASSVSPVEPTLTNVSSSDQPVIYTVLPRDFLSFNLLSFTPRLVVFSVPQNVEQMFQMKKKEKRRASTYDKLKHARRTRRESHEYEELQATRSFERRTRRRLEMATGTYPSGIGHPYLYPLELSFIRRVTRTRRKTFPYPYPAGNPYPKSIPENYI